MKIKNKNKNIFKTHIIYFTYFNMVVQIVGISGVQVDLFFFSLRHVLGICDYKFHSKPHHSNNLPKMYGNRVLPCFLYLCTQNKTSMLSS